MGRLGELDVRDCRLYDKRLVNMQARKRDSFHHAVPSNIQASWKQRLWG